MVEERGVWDTAGRNQPAAAEDAGKARPPWLLAVFALGVLLVLCAGALAFFVIRQQQRNPGNGTELVYRLDCARVDGEIASVTQQLQAARAKNQDAPETRELARQVAALTAAKDSAPDKAVDVVRRRVDPTGTAGILVRTLGSDKQRLRMWLPKATPEEATRIRQAIETQGRLTFHIVTDDQRIIEKTQAGPTKTWTDPNTNVEYETHVMKKPKPFSERGEFGEEPVVIRHVPDMDGSKVLLAMASRSAEGAGYVITVRFSAEGQRQFGDLTRQNIKKRMAIMLDGIVYSAPVIQEPIFGECRITANFQKDEAERLAGVLTAGSLPVELKFESERSVSPAP